MVEIFFQVVVGVIVGSLLGVFTGLAPGVHINLVSLLILSIAPALTLFLAPFAIASGIVAMSIVHTFLDFVPSVYLGAPDSETALAALPGHKLLLDGRGYDAIKLSSIGAFFSLLIVIVLLPLLIFAVPVIFDFVRPYIGWILLFIVLFMILRAGGFQKIFWSFGVFVLSGIFGLVVFSLPQFAEPLFPMLSGLFGVSMLLTSLNEKVVVPPQKISGSTYVSKADVFKTSAAATFSGGLLSIFPGLGPAQAAILGSQILRKASEAEIFIMLTGGVGTVSMAMSLVTLYSIEKARNGSIVVVQELLKGIGIGELMLFAAVALVSACFGVFLALSAAKLFSRMITKVNYSMLCLSVVSFIALLVFYFSGFLGLFVLVVGTAIGIIPGVVKVGRNNAMGVLLMPIIMYFLV